ncbi:MAG: hypothetical protein KME08_05840 [Aphanothece sp. CMT-3BRIN-NPC111]|nr:hypothetical protein [Aphanothece sp. CMT-3BRIN-NPC111]
MVKGERDRGYLPPPQNLPTKPLPSSSIQRLSSNHRLKDLLEACFNLRHSRSS